MAIRNIVKFGDEVLNKKCRPVEKFDHKLAVLLKDMADTLYEADGVGLAAPQVGILRRVVIIDVGDGLIELINPETSRPARKCRTEQRAAFPIPDNMAWSSVPCG